MANEKMCFKDYINCTDDKMLSKTRRKMNSKSHKKRVYGLDWGTSGPVNASGTGAVDGGASAGAVGEGLGMPGGALPGAFSAEVLGGVPNEAGGMYGTIGNSDMKKQNRRSAPKAMPINTWLQYHTKAEEEEYIDEIGEKIERMLKSGITDPEDIADQVGITTDEVISYLEDMFDEKDESSDDEDFDDEDFDDEDTDDEDFDDFGLSHTGIDDSEEYEDFEDEDTDDEDFEDEDTDGYDELDFNNDDRHEHDLDREFTDDEDFEDEDEDDEDRYFARFRNSDEEEEQTFNDEDIDDEDIDDEDIDDEDDDFGHLANKMMDGIGDDVIDDIDDTTGSISRWWREQVINPSEDNERDEDFNREPEEEEEEEQEVGAGMRPAGPPKIDRARMVFQRLINQPNMTRGDIIAAFVDQVDVTHSTAVSYYERLAKEAGLTGQDDDMVGGFGGGQMGARAAAPQQQAQPSNIPPEPEQDMEGEVDTSGDPNRQGIIRTVDHAHLVYKRQTDEGTFEELWVYNIGSSMDDELKVRRAILAGTDIPQNKTQSEDGSQRYSLSTLGNAQLLHITGLPN